MTKIIFDIETLGLNSLKDKITCISCKSIESNVMQSFYGSDIQRNNLKMHCNFLKSEKERIIQDKEKNPEKAQDTTETKRLEKEIEILMSQIEKSILEQFWSKIINGTELIGFNSDYFDIKYLIHRSLINKVKINRNFINKDLRKAINSFFISYNAKEKGTLNDWAKLLFNEEKKSNGLECIEAAKIGDYEFIKKHCESDVDLTFRLYYRLVEGGIL